MAPETCALEGTCHFMLRIESLEFFNRKRKLLFDGSIDTNFMLVFINDANSTVVAIISVLLSDEARSY